MRAKNPTLVAVPKTSPVPKIAATAKTLSGDVMCAENYIARLWQLFGQLIIY